MLEDPGRTDDAIRFSSASSKRTRRGGGRRASRCSSWAPRKFVELVATNRRLARAATKKPSKRFACSVHCSSGGEHERALSWRCSIERLVPRGASRRRALEDAAGRETALADAIEQLVPVEEPSLPPPSPYGWSPCA
jgi:hypothetical protein